MESPTELTSKLACGDPLQSGLHTEVKCSLNRSTFTATSECASGAT